MPTALDIVREFFPEASDDEADYILWEETGFPCFWPDGDKTPEENLRQQLADLKSREPITVNT